MPLCILEKKQLKFVKSIPENLNFIKFKACNNCNFKDKCSGLDPFRLLNSQNLNFLEERIKHFTKI